MKLFGSTLSTHWSSAMEARVLINWPCRSNLSRTVGILVTMLIVASTLSSAQSRPLNASTPKPSHSNGEAPLRDSALRMGTLSNGLRYYIRANSTPAKRAEFWLAVHAGSINEDEDQQGFAHFLEHMAFNGTRHFPKQALIDFVETAGMQFGGDLNAYTNFDETVYMLTLPSDDPKFIRGGLQILEDWAGGGITIDSSEVLAERGVVLGEWRTRMMDTASLNLTSRRQAVLFGPESRYRMRFPIGKPQLLKTAQPEPIRRFYHDWYRPDLMAVIVVGDIDPAQIEREVKRRFDDIPATVNPRAHPSLNLAQRTGPTVDIYRGMVPMNASVAWPAPPSPTSPEAAVRQQLTEQLLFSYLQQIFDKLHTQERRPFGGAAINRARLATGAGDIYSLGVGAMPDSLESGLANALTELERVAQHGIPRAQLEQRKATILRQLESAADGQLAAPSKAFAQAYVQHFLTGMGILLDAAQDLSIAQHVLPSITPMTIAEAARFWRTEQRKIVFYSMYAYVGVKPPTEASLLALMDSVAQLTLVPSGDTTSGGGGVLLSERPSVGRITTERQHSKAGITEWTLSNGARVLYKPTNFNPDELFIQAHSLGGTSLLPDSLALSPGRLVASIMNAAGGLGTSTRDQLEQQLSTTALKAFHVSLNYTDESILMGGSPKDLETLFQLLYLQFTAPKLDTAGLATWKRYGAETLEMSANDQIAAARARGNPRLAPPSPVMVPFVSLEQAMRIYKDRFGDASDFTFYIVGAAPLEQIKPMVERYIATLPSTNRTVREQPIDPKVKDLTEIMRMEWPNLPVPKVSTRLAFDRRLSSDPATYLTEREEIAALTLVLRRRLREELREKLGGTYGVGVAPSFYANPHEHYTMMIAFDAAPDRFDTLSGVLFQQLDSVRQFGATPEELNMVATIRRRTHETQLRSNSYWLITMQHYDRLGIPFARITEAPTTSLTSQRIRDAAQKYLPSSAFIQVTYKPQDSTITDSAISAQSRLFKTRDRSELTRSRDVRPSQASPNVLKHPLRMDSPAVNCFCQRPSCAYQ